MQIVSLEAENIQRISAVRIKADGSPVVVLAGGNEEGKSSCLDAIEMALGGEKRFPPEPVRRGQEKAQIVVDLGDMIVTRRFSKGGSSLVVTNREGLKYPSPQSLLDGFLSKLTFDPLDFANAKPPDQAAILRRLAGLDTSDLDTARAKEFEERTQVNRDLAKARGAFESAPAFDDVGTELEDAGAVLTELAAADDIAAAAAAAQRRLDGHLNLSASTTRSVERAKADVESAREALARAERALVDIEREAELQARATADAKQASERAAAAVPDRSALRAKVAEIQERNRKIEANRRRAELSAEVVRIQADAEARTKRIDALDTEKAQRLANAKFPIEGLGLTAAGVTWNGIPFEQASTAIRTRASVTIGFALHPKLKVLLVRNGNDLDAKNLKLLAEAAAEAGGQLWIERIAGGDGLHTVVIEDGAVKVTDADALARVDGSDGAVLHDDSPSLPLEAAR